MTPLGFTQSVATALAARGLPTPAKGLLGPLQVPCAGTYVTALNVTYQDLGGNCGLIQMVDLIIIAARDCAFTANEDGTTNWTAQDAVSTALNADTQTVLDWVEAARADAVIRGAAPTASFQSDGAIAQVTVQVQLPVP